MGVTGGGYRYGASLRQALSLIELSSKELSHATLRNELMVGGAELGEALHQRGDLVWRRRGVAIWMHLRGKAPEGALHGGFVGGCLEP